MAKAPQRLILGISGASGVIYGIRALEVLRRTGIKIHLVVSKAAELTMSYETDFKPKALRQLASVYHMMGDVGTSISSGSFPTKGMLILPYSVRTMGEIATGVTSSRAQDHRRCDQPYGGPDAGFVRDRHWRGASLEGTDRIRRERHAARAAGEIEVGGSVSR